MDKCIFILYSLFFILWTDHLIHHFIERSNYQQAFDIVTKFLERDPTKRLGYNGFEEIKTHPWFKDIDWDQLYRKETIPPFRPTVKDSESTEQIDTEFTSVMPAVTPTPVNVVLTDQGAFQDFSYAENPVH